MWTKLWIAFPFRTQAAASVSQMNDATVPGKNTRAAAGTEKSWVRQSKTLRKRDEKRRFSPLLWMASFPTALWELPNCNHFGSWRNPKDGSANESDWGMLTERAVECCFWRHRIWVVFMQISASLLFAKNAIISISPDATSAWSHISICDGVLYWKSPLFHWGLSCLLTLAGVLQNLIRLWSFISLSTWEPLNRDIEDWLWNLPFLLLPPQFHQHAFKVYLCTIKG